MDKAPHQQLKPIIQDPFLWGLFENFVAGEKSRCVTRLIKCTESELKGIQGEIKVLDGLLKLRSQLETEARAKR